MCIMLYFMHLYIFLLFKVNSLTKKEIRTYLENDEAIDTVDYLIELKNNKAIKNETSVLESVNSVI